MEHRASTFGAWACVALLGAVPGAALAQATQSPADIAGVEVIATSPLGARGAAEAAPAAVAVLAGDDFRRGGPANILRTLDGRLGGVALTQSQGNPFQPNLLYRGFEASPLAGNAQGLAIYVGGARFNQPFGDTVNWDLLPDIAVARAELVGSNPAFGLNALGGALSFTLKDGFAAPGGEAEVSGGSFGRRQASVLYGHSDDRLAGFFAVSALDDDGWRDHSPSRLRQAYGDLGRRRDGAEVHLSLMGADNALTGNGPAPVGLLAQDRSAVFTYPDQTLNRYARAVLSGSQDLGGNWTLRGVVYGARLRQRTTNGDAAEVEPCGPADTLLCPEDETVALTDAQGRPIGNFIAASPYVADFPRYAAGGPYALLNQTASRIDSFGAGVQASGEVTLFGRPNRLAAGAGLDAGRTRFSAGSILGGLSTDRAWFGPGVAVDAPDAGIIPAGLRARTEDWSLFVSDAIEASDAVSLTVSARYDDVRIRLRDQIGDELNGDHRFRRLNPAAGLAWRLGGGVSAYAGYARASRAPTPAELSCADPDAPCSLTNFFVSDPPLKRVDAATVEAGLRGARSLSVGGRLTWRAGVYRTDARNDIQIVASETTGRGYFTNVGETRREGLEAGVTLRTERLTGYVDYGYTRATYRSGFVLNAGSNPAFDDEADPMTVRPGDRRPDVPAHNLKAGLDVTFAGGWTVGGDGQVASGRWFAGDEANVTRKTSGYWIAGAHVARRLGERLTVYARVENLFDRRYATFGTFAPLEAVPVTEAPELDDPRSVSPGAPRAFYVGLRSAF